MNQMKISKTSYGKTPIQQYNAQNDNVIIIISKLASKVSLVSLSGVHTTTRGISACSQLLTYRYECPYRIFVRHHTLAKLHMYTTNAL